MAGHILNKSAEQKIISDVFNQNLVESKLKAYSDSILKNIPGYDKETGLALQTRKARAVFFRRNKMDRENTWRNIGSTIALETISHQHLIPGEKHCLIDNKLYSVNLKDNEMHYLEEHWGELGAEKEHEANALQILDSIINKKNAKFIMEGVNDFLNSLYALWNFLDSVLLQSGITKLDDCLTQSDVREAMMA